jgi:hypothetical protein
MASVEDEIHRFYFAFIFSFMTQYQFSLPGISAVDD